MSSHVRRIEGGHDWFPDPIAEDEIDVWRVEGGFHNGPECRRCGFSACHHCNPGIYDQKCHSGQTEIPL